MLAFQSHTPKSAFCTKYLTYIQIIELDRSSEFPISTYVGSVTFIFVLLPSIVRRKQATDLSPVLPPELKMALIIYSSVLS